MDQETAKTFFKEGAFLFLLDFPVGSEVGIDLESWNTGEKFKGIKMIPPGNHFVYYSVANKEGQTAPRSGFFIHLHKKEVVVKRWDPKTEDFVDVSSLSYALDNGLGKICITGFRTNKLLGNNRSLIKPDGGFPPDFAARGTITITHASKLEALKSNLESLDSFLGPYPYDIYKRWISLSHRISREVIENIEPLSKRINSVADLIPSKTFQQKHRHRDSKKVVELESKDEAAEPTKVSTTADDFLLPEMHHRPGTNLRFTEIPAKRFPEGASLQEITTYSLDSTHILKQLLSDLESPLLLLGELQFAFLTFLVGQSYLGFEQWKQLVNTIATSDKAIMEIPEFFLEFLNDLFFQLSEVSEDFFVDIVSQNNFLVQTLHTLFSNIDECPEAGQLDKESPLKTLKERAAKLREHLERRFKWDFGVEPDDEAPVIVDL